MNKRNRIATAISELCCVNGSRLDVFDLMYECSLPYAEIAEDLNWLKENGAINATESPRYFRTAMDGADIEKLSEPEEPEAPEAEEFNEDEELDKLLAMLREQSEDEIASAFADDDDDDDDDDEDEDDEELIDDDEVGFEEDKFYGSTVNKADVGLARALHAGIAFVERHGWNVFCSEHLVYGIIVSTSKARSLLKSCGTNFVEFIIAMKRNAANYVGERCYSLNFRSTVHSATMLAETHFGKQCKLTPEIWLYCALMPAYSATVRLLKEAHCDVDLLRRRLKEFLTI